MRVGVSVGGKGTFMNFVLPRSDIGSLRNLFVVVVTRSQGGARCDLVLGRKGDGLSVTEIRSYRSRQFTPIIVIGLLIYSICVSPVYNRMSVTSSTCTQTFPSFSFPSFTSLFVSYMIFFLAGPFIKSLDSSIRPRRRICDRCSESPSVPRDGRVGRRDNSHL